MLAQLKRCRCQPCVRQVIGSELFVQAQLAQCWPFGTQARHGHSGWANRAAGLVLLKNARPGTLQVNRPAIEQLLDAALPIGDYTAGQADKLRKLLKQAATRLRLATARPKSRSCGCRARATAAMRAGSEKSWLKR